MTDTTIRVNGAEYNIVVYRCAEHGGYRAEAGYRGRVIEVVDTPSEQAAWIGIREMIERRNGASPR
jgi:hypothetical protein